MMSFKNGLIVIFLLGLVAVGFYLMPDDEPLPKVFVQLGHLDVLAVAFSPDGKLALSGSSDKTLKLWDV